MREMGRIYRVSGATICRWVKGEGEGWNKEPERLGRSEDSERPKERPKERRTGAAETAETAETADVRQLRKELEEARLYNELLNAMIDIAEEQFEIPIRKKSGAKQR